MFSAAFSKTVVFENAAQGVALGGTGWRLILARQQDGLIGEVEADLVQREVGEFDLLGEHHAVITVVTGEGCGLVGRNGQAPNLEFFGGDGRLRLVEGDFVDQPVSSAMLSDILRALGIEDIAGQAVTEPLFAAGEVGQVGFGKGFRCHFSAPVFVTPTAGATVTRAEANRLTFTPPTRERSEWSGLGV